ncbi:MAG: TatD family hydrolase [Clostridiales bacterium]|nr:TatD family hydrolase [Clostridiales bacterium]
MNENTEAPGFMSGAVDVHCHYGDARFEGVRDETIRRLSSLGITLIENGTDIGSSEECVSMAARYDNVYAAVGIYPGETGKIGDEAAVIKRLDELLEMPGVVALGEIGLDRHWPEPPIETQKRWFDIQLAAAAEHGRPVEIHDREAHGECVDAVRSHPKTRGMFHCFSGSAETARELTSLGWYISFGGAVTFKNAKKAAEAAAAVPDEFLLIETDAPYMAPVPRRGETCTSDMMAYTAARLAEIRGMPPEDIIRLTSENAKRLFGI